MSAIARRQRPDTPPVGAGVIALAAIALVAPLVTAIVAAILATRCVGGHRWLWTGIAVFGVAVLLFLLVTVGGGPIEQPVRVD